MKTRWGCAVIVTIALLGAKRATAENHILAFALSAPTAGTIGYAGGATPLVGTSIEVDSVVGLPSGLPASATCTGCVLNFTTGNLTGSDAAHWYFGGGGSIAISGAVPDASINVATTLLSGSFDEAQVESTSGTLKIALAGFNDTKNSILTEYFDTPNVPVYRGFLTLSFSLAAMVDAPNAFSSSVVLSGDVLNSACRTDADCGDGGHCADGVCCDTACGCGTCNAMGSVGTCTTPVDTAGAAGDPSCAPYLCDGASTECASSCADDADCANGNFCEAEACVPQEPLGSACSGGNMCASTFCVDDVCCESACGQSEFACNLEGRVGLCSRLSNAPALSPWALAALALSLGAVVVMRLARPPAPPGR